MIGGIQRGSVLVCNNINEMMFFQQKWKSLIHIRGCLATAMTTIITMELVAVTDDNRTSTTHLATAGVYICVCICGELMNFHYFCIVIIDSRTYVILMDFHQKIRSVMFLNNPVWGGNIKLLCKITRPVSVIVSKVQAAGQRIWHVKTYVVRLPPWVGEGAGRSAAARPSQQWRNGHRKGLWW